MTELFRKCNSDALELVDITERVPGNEIFFCRIRISKLSGLISRKGLLSWPVCETKAKENMQEEKKEGEIESSEKKETTPESFFDIYESVDQIPKDYKGQLRATMFPDTLEKMRDVYKIQNTVRLMPHDQNTGGFYLALIRKKNHVVFGGQGSNEGVNAGKPQVAEAKVTVEEDDDAEAIKKVTGDVDEKEALKHALEATGEGKEEGENKQEVIEEEPVAAAGSEQKEKKKKKETFVTLEKPDWESIRDYYGLDEKLRDLLIQQTPGDKKVYLISPGIRKILDLDKSKGKILNKRF